VRRHRRHPLLEGVEVRLLRLEPAFFFSSVTEMAEFTIAAILTSLRDEKCARLAITYGVAQ